MRTALSSTSGTQEEEKEKDKTKATLDSLRKMLSSEDADAIDIKAFTKLIEDPEFPSARVEGILLRHKSRSEALLRKVLPLSSSEKEHLDACTLLCLILEAEGRHEEEETELKPMIDHAKTVEHKALAHASYGTFLKNLGRNEEAMVHFSKSVELRPTEVQYLLDYANLLYEKGQNNKASKLVRRAISFLRPGDGLRTYLKNALKKGERINPPPRVPSAGSLGRFMRTEGSNSVTKLIEEVKKRNELFKAASDRDQNPYLISAKQSGDYIEAILDIERDKERRQEEIAEGEKIGGNNEDDANYFTYDELEEWAVQNWITILNDWKPGFELYLNEIFFKDKCGTSNCKHPEGSESRLGIVNCPLDVEFDEYVFEVVERIVKVARSGGDLRNILELQIPEDIEKIERRLRDI